MPANEIVPSLWIGDLHDAHAAQGRVDVMINVLENPRTSILFPENSERVPGEIWMPIAYQLPAKWPEVGDMVADRQKLNAVAETIDRNLKAGKTVMVHCVMGQERSPLTVIWYLHKKRHMSLENAYQYVKQRRRQTATDILSWLR